MINKLAASLILIVGTCPFSYGTLQWVAVGNQPNANNVNAASGVQNTNNNGADTGEITIGVIPTADQLASSDTLLTNIASYTVNLGVDLGGALDGSSVTVTASDFLPGFSTTFGSDPLTQPVSDGGTMMYVTVGPTTALSTLPDPVTGRIDVMKLVFSAPGGQFTDDANGILSQISVDILPGAFPSQTQFGRIGTLDAPQNADPLFNAFPTANPNAPNSGVTAPGHVLAVGVPEPSSFLFLNLVVVALGGMGWYRKRLSALTS